MSRIFEAIRMAKESRSKNGLDNSELLGEMELPERRITPRLEMDLDLTVYGRSSGENTFYEQAKAIGGNANGGTFLLPFAVTEGQDLLLINNSTSEEQICNIVSVLVRDTQECEVSVSFPLPNADFWKVRKAEGNL